MANSTDLSYLELNGTTMGYILMTINIVIFFPVVIGNTFVLIAYKNTPKLRAPINLLLVNLALTDLCTAICSIPWTILGDYLTLEIDKNKYFCLLGYLSRHIPLGVSCITMLFIGIVRAISVFKPFHSKIWITHKRIGILMLLIWIYLSILVGGYVFINHDWSPDKPCDMKEIVGSTYTVILGAHLIVVAIVSTAFYISFIAFIRKSTQANSQHASRADMDIERRTTNMVMTVVLCFYACWFPALIYIIIRLIIFKDSAESYWGNVTEHFTLFICFCNSFMNPFIYAGFNATFKSAFLRYLNIIFCIKRKTPKSCSIPHSPELGNSSQKTNPNIDNFPSETARLNTSEEM